MRSQNPRAVRRTECPLYGTALHGRLALDSGSCPGVGGRRPPQDAAARRLEMLTLAEAHDLLRLLHLMAAEGPDELSEEVEWFAREIAARVPSDN
ncbi:DUF6417 family protein [Streptomyces niveus]|uniref:DUF6417 family protein n=1 Tax=Streptomyces niveus TaxID=193462 RepID=UPI003833880C